ncbi:18369_t:CDS:2, partial [Funneliformis geosporum]
EQARRIHPDIEELFTSNVNKYYKNGFKKQLEKREALLIQKEINIKKTIEDQVDEKCKYLKDEYYAFMVRKESEYYNCMRQYKSHICALDKSNAAKDKEI